ncbi:MAG: chloride channel protein [Prevotella sp.]|uniref:chloride channel protein n=1 Tax=Prevotella sp. TaxID=59823 RepID=UPI002A31B455|nr:chloride channel protein [Prevotella sp.]MDD7318182.1 chloride channel protein [Prevotellaceae bacterium]MDY4020929.1 chloride channel protein [Prevotella sp.]
MDSGVLLKFVEWRGRHVSDRQFTLLLSFVVGFLAAVAGYVLHWIISEIQFLLTAGFDITSFNWMYLVLPVVGIYLTSLFVRYIVRDDIGHGITRILYAISSKKSRIRGHNCWSSVVASAITIGFGGSVGAEAPIVLTGSAIGSNLGKLFRMDNKTMMLLVGCGASAAIAGVFKAPIAGLVFTLEVLMVDLTMASLLPILISSVTATCFTYIFTGSASLFNFTLDDNWMLDRVPATILLGVCCGFFSLWFIRASGMFERMFERLGKKHLVRLILGGSVISMLIFLFPSLFGEGYSSIDILLNGKTEADWQTIMNNSLFYGHSDMLIIYVGLVVFTKVFATTATNGGGGCGGTFAPSLFMGAFGGFFFSRLWNMYQIGTYVPEKNFTLLGMAGVMTGVMHAPLTGIFLIAELTGGYAMFIPLMIVCICAYLTIIIFEPHSIYGMRLARQGKLITHHTDHAVLTLMSLDSVIEREVTTVSPDMKLGKLIHFISRSRMSIVPVVDEAGQLLGEIDVTKIRHVMFRTELYGHFRVSELMTEPPAVLGDNDSMDEVMKKFDSTDALMLPVVDSFGILKGYVARTHIYSQYRQMVADMSAE